MADRHQVFGIRHHGPGSARSLLTALSLYQPDVLLIEGPPEADGLIAAVTATDMQPPVALLVYAREAPERSAFYPFAQFSPEWQAMQFGLRAGVPVRFCDLPAMHQLATAETTHTKRPDPWLRLGQLSGIDEPENLWERWVEERPGGLELFAAVASLMAELRTEVGCAGLDLRREAWMRQQVRLELKAGRQRIAVVCGAWHAPALLALPGASSDQALLRGLPRIQVAATWVPWSHDRLALDSGYGAGVRSPGWFAHLWERGAADPAWWITRAVQILRAEGLEVGPAQAIEATRLAQALARLRGRTEPALAELDQALLSVVCGGEALPLKCIERELNVGEVLGQVPEDTPKPPICADLERLQQRLRLRPETRVRELELDLRRELDRRRSELLHQLALLEVHWGREPRSQTGTGTFRESWSLCWDPSLVLPLIDAARYGNEVLSAAGQKVLQRAAASTEVAELAQLLGDAFKAGLAQIQPQLAARLDALAATRGELVELMQAFVRLAPIARYGDVRNTDLAALAHTLQHYFARICIGLRPAASAINDEAAAGLLVQLVAVDQTLRRVDPSQAFGPEWRRTLERLLDPPVHPLLAGRAVRLLFDREQLAPDEVSRRLGLALSPALAASQAAWIEGLLGDSGLILLHLPQLLALLDGWLGQLPATTFIEVLPLLRRAFARFPAAERRVLGRTLAQSASGRRSTAPVESALDLTRAASVVPVLRLLWGKPAGGPHGRE